MGLLTDPSAGHSPVVRLVVNMHSKVFGLLYIGGLVWFYCLAMVSINNETYFSENALLPGLVKNEFTNIRSTQRFYDELNDEMSKYDNSLPYPWLLAKMRQLGLDAYTHDFKLYHPLNRTLVYKGRNVYGIMRAPRAASMESLILSTPFRPPNSVHESTAASIAYMLSFAEFTAKGKYWAKDIIFLITEYEQLGMQAWLEAYHGVTNGKPGVLNHGDLDGRAGAIQAAINLEFHALNLAKMEMKIEGLNGQLPNLDLFNLIAKICVREKIPQTFKGRQFRDYSNYKTDANIKTLLQMVLTQAPGIPTGNHGLFFRYGIQALTLEGFGSAGTKSSSPILAQQRLIESTFRSLNNLLERFHQSYFFYLLAASDRFISIGLYMPTLCLLIATFFVKAFVKTCILNRSPITGSLPSEKRAALADYVDDDLGSGVIKPSLNLKTEEEWLDLFEQEQSKVYKFHLKEVNLGTVFVCFLLAHFFGAFARFSPYIFVQIGAKYTDFSMEYSVYLGLALFSVLFLLLPVFLPKPNYRTMAVLNIIAILELGTTLLCIGMYNISLGICLCTFIAPFAHFIYPKSGKFCKRLQRFAFLFIHPFILLHIALIIYAKFNFPEEPLIEVFYRSFSGTKNAIVFSVVDSDIYGHWLYAVVCCILYPAWLCLWTSSFGTPTKNDDELDAVPTTNKKEQTSSTSSSSKKQSSTKAKKE